MVGDAFPLCSHLSFIVFYVLELWALHTHTHSTNSRRVVPFCNPSDGLLLSQAKEPGIPAVTLGSHRARGRAMPISFPLRFFLATARLQGAEVVLSRVWPYCSAHSIALSLPWVASPALQTSRETRCTPPCADRANLHPSACNWHWHGTAIALGCSRARHRLRAFKVASLLSNEFLEHKKDNAFCRNAYWCLHS